MKYVFIEKHQAEFCIKAMCRALRVARNGWYMWCQRRTRIGTRQQFRQHCDYVVFAVLPGQNSVTAHTACLCQKICWSRIFTPVARTRSGRETSRTYVRMKAGCIWQWSLTCGYVPLLADQCRHA